MPINDLVHQVFSPIHIWRGCLDRAQAQNFFGAAPGVIA
jgi:hypothetical protein